MDGHPIYPSSIFDGIIILIDWRYPPVYVVSGRKWLLLVVVVMVTGGGDWWCDGLIFPPQNWRLMSMSLSRAQMQVSRSGDQNRPTATDTAAKWHSLSRAACHQSESALSSFFSFSSGWMSPEREVTVSEISYYSKAKSPSPPPPPPPPAPTRETFFPLAVAGQSVPRKRERVTERERRVD
jgi:hypothetical protein